MTEYLLETPDRIRRDLEGFDGKAVLLSEDGDIEYLFPAEMRDEHILAAIRFANQAHRWGVACGRHEVQRELFTALSWMIQN